ncbi:MAG: hypothetical protein KJO79_03460 [Verrucomicrobiae bacterium]|nr:hypothetical protein [Verrucomicrobiae bacterium]NNJ86214.1 hypothetical protein [Akkermansiaceae bacterium]
MIDWSGLVPNVLGDGQILNWSETRSDDKHFYRLLGGVITREPQDIK